MGNFQPLIKNPNPQSKKSSGIPFPFFSCFHLSLPPSRTHARWASWPWPWRLLPGTVTVTVTGSPHAHGCMCCILVYCFSSCSSQDMFSYPRGCSTATTFRIFQGLVVLIISDHSSAGGRSFPFCFLRAISRTSPSAPMAPNTHATTCTQPSTHSRRPHSREPSRTHFTPI